MVNNTDFKAEFANAERYKNSVLTSELPFLQEEMKQEKIDAFNYASTEYGVGSALKDGVKDKLKGMATWEPCVSTPCKLPNTLFSAETAFIYSIRTQKGKSTGILYSTNPASKTPDLPKSQWKDK